MKGFSTISLIVALGAAIFLAAAVFFMSKGSTYSPFPKSLTTRLQPTPAEYLTNGEITATFDEIINHGQSLACDFKIPVSRAVNPFNSGKLWTTGGKGRSTVNTTVANIRMEANALYQNGTVYTWIYVGNQKIGMKFDPESLSEADQSLTPQQRQQAEQFRSSMVFDCRPWTPDETKFILPQDVEFEER